MGRQRTAGKTTKPADQSMLGRFDGEAGRRHLNDVLSATFLLHDVVDLSSLVEAAQLHEKRAGETLMQQGAADNSIHIVISGCFDIEVNGRFWTTRTAGNHLGEAAMIDPTARRNATARAVEDSIVLTCPEEAFSKFANERPEIWRRIAVELSRRLTERTKLTPVPRSEPVMFLGCSSEANEIANEIQLAMSHDSVLVKIWTNGVFHPSKTAIEDLTTMANSVDFAAVLLTPDDKTISRGKSRMSPRDNVIFELGLMLGAIGRERTFFILPRGTKIKLPTDLLGITPLEYQPTANPSEISVRLGPACTELRRTIKRLGPI